MVHQHAPAVNALRGMAHDQKRLLDDRRGDVTRVGSLCSGSVEGAPGRRELSSGTMLDDKYRIERLLATGGMGSVYLGTHVRLRKRVAIKLLNPELSSAPMVERFHREAITASQIGHEGIAQVTDMGTSALGEPFLVMEYLEGESLASRLKSSGALAIEDACELGCAILSPLAAAHAAGIIHRDLKPDNVFLVRQSRGEMVKLLDFGISRTVDRDATFRLTTTGLVLGTPYYMSPEQARGDSEVTVAADLYAFGVILYEMLVGDVPIRAENYNQLMYRVMIGDFVWPRRRRANVPEALEQLIVRAMAQEPRDRPTSATEIEQALLAFCRPLFRDHASGGLSASGSLYRSSGARPGGIGGNGPDSHHGVRIAATPLDQALASQPGLGNVGTQLTMHPAPARLPEPAAVSGVAPTAGAAPRRRLTAWIVGGIALVTVGGVIAAAVAMTGGGADSPAAGARPSVDVPTASSEATTSPVAPAPPAASPAPPAVSPGPAAHSESPPVEAAAPHAGEPSRAPTITLRLAIEPKGAAITLDGRRVSGPEIALPRDDKAHRLRITAPGYLAHEETIAFDENQRVTVQLKRPAARAKGPKDPDGIDSQSPYH